MEVFLPLHLAEGMRGIRMRLVYWLPQVLVELRAFCVTAVGICKVKNGDFWRGKENSTKILCLFLSFTFNSFEAIKTSGLAISNSECYLNIVLKDVGIIQTPNVGSYWCNQFPETPGNSYLPS